MNLGILQQINENIAEMQNKLNESTLNHNKLIDALVNEGELVEIYVNGRIGTLTYYFRKDIVFPQELTDWLDENNNLLICYASKSVFNVYCEFMNSLVQYRDYVEKL